MSFLKKTLISSVKIALIVAVIYYGATWCINKYAQSNMQNVMPPGVPEGASLGRRATTAEKRAAEKAVTQEEARKDIAKQHYLAGIKYLQDARYKKARDEFTIGSTLDPADKEIRAALERVNKILAPAPDEK